MSNVIHIAYNTLENTPETGVVWLVDRETNVVMAKFYNGVMECEAPKVYDGNNETTKVA